MRDALGALTSRGRGFIAAGLTAALCGVVFGERDLVRVGVLVVVLPLIAAAWLARSGNQLGLARTVSPHQVETGQQTLVQLDITNLGSTTGVLLLEERIPHALGSRPRFVIEWLGPGLHRHIEYPVMADVRGKYDLGPLTVRVGDPFGMIERHRTSSQTSSLIVTPTVLPLPPIRLRGAWAGSGDNRPRPFTLGHVADVTVRDYRRGDDLRRVHWRSTARTGELMVRREEQPWQSRCTLFVDNRARSHRGHAPDSSLEKAIVATASIAVHLARQGYQVRLVSATGEELGHGWHDGGMSVDPRPLLECLAVLPTASGPLHGGWIDESVGQQLFVAVLGFLDDHDRSFLTRLHATGGSSYALVMDVDEWAARTDKQVGTSATAWLHARGWKAADVGLRTPIAQSWQELGR